MFHLDNSHVHRTIALRNTYKRNECTLFDTSFIRQRKKTVLRTFVYRWVYIYNIFVCVWKYNTINSRIINCSARKTIKNELNARRIGRNRIAFLRAFNNNNNNINNVLASKIEVLCKTLIERHPSRHRLDLIQSKFKLLLELLSKCHNFKSATTNRWRLFCY